jgi:nucleotide-binding universal stress UspA family protein
VLLPLDGSDLASGAISTGIALAERFDAVLHTISVAASNDEAERMLARARDSVGRTTADENVQVVRDTEPANAIDDRARELEPCLVCMSTHGRGRVSGAVIGSVARSLLQRRDEPMVVVGPDAERPEALVGARRRLPSDWRPPLFVNRIVACVDGSATSEAIIPVAAAWATALEMSLTILTIAEDVMPPLRLGSELMRRFGPNGDADEYIDRLAQQWKASAPDVSGRAIYDPISPADGVRSHLYEESAGLVAVATHARSGVQRIKLGAGAANIVRASVVPALVVPVEGP